MKKLISILILFSCAAFAQISDTRVPRGNGYVALNAACTNANTSCDTASTVFGENGTVLGPLTLEFNTISYGEAVVYMNGNSTAVGATLAFEFSDDGGVDWYSNVCTRSDSNIQESSEAVPATTWRAWDCAVGAATRMRVRLTAISSGVVNIAATLTAGLIEPAPTVAITNTVGSSDPCANPSVLKKTAFASGTTATTTALVAVSGTTQVYICSALVFTVGTSTSASWLLEQGTGATCAGAPTAITATYTSVPGSGGDVFSWGGGSSTIATGAAANGICIVTTVGTAPQWAITISYVQQ